MSLLSSSAGRNILKMAVENTLRRYEQRRISSEQFACYIAHLAFNTENSYTMVPLWSDIAGSKLLYLVQQNIITTDVFTKCLAALPSSPSCSPEEARAATLPPGPPGPPGSGSSHGFSPNPLPTSAARTSSVSSVSNAATVSTSTSDSRNSRNAALAKTAMDEEMPDDIGQHDISLEYLFASPFCSVNEPNSTLDPDEEEEILRDYLHRSQNQVQVRVSHYSLVKQLNTGAKVLHLSGHARLGTVLFEDPTFDRFTPYSLYPPVSIQEPSAAVGDQNSAIRSILSLDGGGVRGIMILTLKRMQVPIFHNYLVNRLNSGDKVLHMLGPVMISLKDPTLDRFNQHSRYQPTTSGHRMGDLFSVSNTARSTSATSDGRDISHSDSTVYDELNALERSARERLKEDRLLSSVSADVYEMGCLLGDIFLFNPPYTGLDDHDVIIAQDNPQKQPFSWVDREAIDLWLEPELDELFCDCEAMQSRMVKVEKRVDPAVSIIGICISITFDRENTSITLYHSRPAQIHSTQDCRRW